MRILVIGAHPADPVDLAGGTVYLQGRIGDGDVWLACMTDGLFSHTSRVVNLEEKRREFKRAAGAVGVSALSCQFFGLQDEPLQFNREVVRDVAKALRIIRPDVIITHHPNEYAHWDHHECGEIVCRAVKAAIKLPAAECSGLEPHGVRLLLFFAVQFRPEVARVGAVPQPPDILVDLPEEVVAKKVAAMRCFASQGHDNEEAMWQRMNSFEREMGRADGLKYSEGFILGSPLKVDLLPKSKSVSFYKVKQ